MDNTAASIWFSKRLRVAIILFVGFANSSMLLNNIDIAVVEMTSERLITVGNTTIVRPAEFQWSRATIGVVSSVHAYAYFLPFFGSCLVNRLGGSISSVLSLVVGGIVTILQEAILNWNFYMFLASRVIVGLSTSFYLVCTAEIFSRWYPKKERTTLISISYSGTILGSIITYPLYGYIAYWFGWQMVFYASGTISVIISFLIMVTVKNDPSEDKTISKQELFYILDGTDITPQQKVDHPYRKILSSAPVLAVCAAKFAFLWVQCVIALCLPLYVKDMTQRTTNIVGLVSSIPLIPPLILFPLSGSLLDYWKNHTRITTTTMHKIMITIVYLTTSVLLAAAVSLSNFTVTMATLILIQVVQSAAAPIPDSLTVQIAPNDSSIIAGLMSITIALGTIVSRTVVGLLTTHHSLTEWNNCFLLAAAVLISGNVIFLIYGSSEAQPWSLPENEEERRHLMDKNDRT